jgi:uncharacterized membrane protein (UPF0182 family)
MERNPPPKVLRLEPGHPFRRVSRAVKIALVAVLLLVFAVPPGIRLGTSLLWFREIGFETVFLTELTTKLALFAAVAAGS